MHHLKLGGKCKLEQGFYASVGGWRLRQSQRPTCRGLQGTDHLLSGLAAGPTAGCTVMARSLENLREKPSGPCGGIPKTHGVHSLHKVDPAPCTQCVSTSLLPTSPPAHLISCPPHHLPTSSVHFNSPFQFLQESVLPSSLCLVSH